MDLTERRSGRARHPWEVQRFEAYRRVLADHGALDATRVLDVGSGDSWFAEALSESLPPDAEIVCWDVNYGDDELTEGRPGTMRTRSATTAGFDLVLALDVLEHIEDAAAFVTGELAPLADSAITSNVARSGTISGGCTPQPRAWPSGCRSTTRSAAPRCSTSARPCAGHWPSRSTTDGRSTSN